jgi:hypothetical protein
MSETPIATEAASAAESPAKPVRRRRKANPAKPKIEWAIPFRTCQQIVEKHVFEDTLKSAPTVWGRELKLLRDLLAGGHYADANFWLTLGLGFQLHSLAWFKTAEGAAELERHWRLYQFTKVQEQQQREAREKAEAAAAARAFLGDENDESQDATPALPRKLSNVEWADATSL